MMRKAFGFLLICLSLCVSSCRDELFLPEHDYVEPIALGETAEQQLVFYIVGDNNLSSDFQKDLAEVLEAASCVPSDSRLLAFVDDKHAPRILSFFNNDGKGDYETLHNFEDEMSSCDTVVMGQVFAWIFDNCPTKELDIVFESHGSGWLYDDGRLPQLYSFGEDGAAGVTSNNKRLYVEELAALMKRFPVKPRTVMFDACFMQCAEVAYAMRDCAEWLIASPAEIPGAGAPYDRLVPLFFDPVASYSDIIDTYVAAYESNPKDGVVLSAVRLDAMQQLADATAMLVKGYLSAGGDGCDGVDAYLPGGYFKGGYKYPDFYDFNAVMAACVPQAEHDAWREAFDKAVVYAGANKSYYSYIIYRAIAVGSECGAMSLFLPKNDSRYRQLNVDFTALEWYRAVGWNEAGW